MNPDTGRIHELMTPEERAEEQRARSRANPDLGTLLREEIAEQKLLRAIDGVEIRRPPTPRLDDEGNPVKLEEVPVSWPTLRVGDEVAYKGWFFRVEMIDAETQRVVIKPHRPTNATKRRSSGERPHGDRGRSRRRKRGRG